MLQLYRTVVIALLAGVAAGAVEAQQPPGGSDTRSVWDGVFSAEQSERGGQYYAEHCAHCHGDDLQGTADAKTLKGDRFWTDWKETTVDYMLDRISKSMPFSEDGALAGSLNKDTYVDIVAHILSANGFPRGDKELTWDSSAGVRIISKNGSGELPATVLARVVGCLARATDGTWRLEKATRPARVLAGAPRTPADNAPLGDREFALKFVLVPLDKYLGYRMSVTGMLIGEGGVDGLNLSTTTPIAPDCK